MVDYNINFNVKKDKTTGTRSTQKRESSSIDAPSIKRLTEGVGKILHQNQTRFNSSLEKTLFNAVKTASASGGPGKGAGGSSGGGKGGISNSELRRIIKGIVAELAGPLLKQISSAVSGVGAGRTGTQDVVGKDIVKAIDKSSDVAARAIETAFSKHGIKLDPSAVRDIKNSTVGAVARLLPKNLDKAISQLSSSVDKMTQFYGTLSKSVTAASKIRKSGGGVSISETLKFTKTLRDMMSEYKALQAEAKQFRNTLKEIAGDTSTVYKELTKMVSDVKSSATSKVTRIQQRAKDDPKELVRLFTKELTSIITKSPTMKDTKLEKLLSTLAGNFGNIEDLAKAMKNIQSELKKKISTKDLSIEGAKELIASLKRLESAVGKIPSAAPASDNKLIKQLEKFSTGASKIIKTIEVVLSTKEGKVIEKVLKTAAEKGVKEGIKAGIKSVDTGFEPYNPYLYTSAKKATKKGIEDGAKEAKVPVPDIKRQAAHELHKIRPQAIKAQQQKGMLVLPPEYDKDILKQWSIELNKHLEQIFSSALKKAETLDPESKKSVVSNVRQAQAAYKRGDMFDLSSSIGGLHSKSFGTENSLKLTKEIESSLRDALTILNVVKGSVVGKEFVALGQATAELTKEVATTKDEIKAAPSKEIADGMKATSKEVDGLTKAVVEQKKEVEKQTKQLKREGDITGPPSSYADVKTKEQYVTAQKTAPGAAGKPGVIQFPEKIISPREAGLEIDLSQIKGDTAKYSESIVKSVEQNISDLSTSLYSLQNTIISTLDTEFEKSKNRWAVAKKSGETDVQKIFRQMGSIGGKGVGRQWAVDIVNVAEIKSDLGKSQEDATEVLTLVEEYKAKLINSMVKKGAASMAEDLGKYIKLTPKDVIVKAPKSAAAQNILKDLKEKYNTGVEAGKELIDEIQDRFGTDLAAVFIQTAGIDKAIKEMRGKDILKTVAIPAARLTPTGAASFETAHGSLRALPKFAKFRTGFERMFDDIQSERQKEVKREREEAEKRGETPPKAIKGITGELASLAQEIQRIQIKPEGPEELIQAEEVAKKLIIKMAELQPERVKKQFRAAATSRGAELTKLGVMTPETIPQFEQKINAAIQANDIKQSVDGFLDAMDKAGVSAYAMVKSLDSIRFENVYQIIEKVLQGSVTGKTPLTTLGSQPGYGRSLRDFESAINEVQQLLPLSEIGRPRRAGHIESMVNLQTRTSPLYDYSKGGEDLEQLTPDDQKRLIKDMNVRFKEMFSEIDTLSKTTSEGARTRLEQLPQGIQTLSSLGLPEASAGAVSEYRERIPKAGAEYLSTLNTSVVKMYSDNLADMAPFGQQFQQLGRNISNVSNAMTNIAGTAEFPTLQTERERAQISAGKFGTGGLGYNIITEFKHTANTFEDQVLISGKLASALTSVVKTLVQPSARGRIDTGGLLSPGATDISPQVLKQSGRAEKAIGADEIVEVSKKFQEILGVPEEYTGRAEQAFIDEVQKALTVVRGDTVEVQMARITETFMNHFGRKLTTRFGSKGVSLTPTGGAIQSALQAFGSENLPKIKVLTKEERAKSGLGTAVLPKSMGELASEILGKELPKLIDAGMSEKVVKSLQTQLINSGNKFILDLFTGVEASKFTVPEETRAGKSAFTGLETAFGKIGITLEKDIAGIRQIKSEFEARVGKETFKERPIDLRISAHGVAKRGLQTEVLESVMNNIIGTGTDPTGAGKRAPTTVIKADLSESYKELLGEAGKPGKLAEYSKALGFAPAKEGLVDIATRSKAQKEIEKELMEKYGFNEAEAQRGAALEAVSSYYSDVTDETGKRRKGLVGPKFVQIIEEPGETREWEADEVQKLIKGERANLAAFSAYATVFGEQSAFMKELQKGVEDATGKHWEYIKALQVLNDGTGELQEALFASLEEIDFSKIKEFKPSTGLFADPSMLEDPTRSLKDTVLDVKRFPSAFKTTLPTGVKGEREEFYVPGPLARQTFPEKLIAGERGLDVHARRLTHVINMGKELEEKMVDPAAFVEPLTVMNSLPKIVAKRLGDITRVLNNYKGKSSEADMAEARKQADVLGKQLRSVVAKYGTTKIDPRIDPARRVKAKDQSEQAYVDAWTESFVGRVGKKGSEGITADQATVRILARISDVVIGPSEAAVKEDPELAKNITVLKRVFSPKKDQDKARDIGRILEGGFEQDVIDKAIASMQKSKIEYYNSLAKAAIGKKGSVQELVFTRKAPAVIGKAVVAAVDKTDDFKNFYMELTAIQEKHGDLLGSDNMKQLMSVQKDMAKVAIAHGQALKEQIRKGLPLLKETELGIPENVLKKMPVEFRRFKAGRTKTGERRKGEKVSGTMFDMMEHMKQLRSRKDIPEAQQEEYKKDVEEYIEKDLSPYIESVRFPFTGISSLQPFKPRALQKRFKGMGAQSLVVPGTPEFGEEAGTFKKARERAKETVKSLFEEREALYDSDLPEAGNKIKQLTMLIDRLNKAITDLTPKYIAQQMKLDFDGDQIEIHAAQTGAARKDIKKHFNSMFKDMDSTASRWREDFTYDAFQPTTSQYVLAEQSKSFAKKFQPERGFEFLKTPFMTEGLEHLGPGMKTRMLAERGQGGLQASATRIKDVVSSMLETLDLPEDIVSKSAVDQAMKEVQDISVPKIDPSVAEEESRKLLDSYANGLIEAVAKVNSSLSVALKKSISSMAEQTRYEDAIEANLFKIHTGMETEAVYGLQRVAEMRVGFGGGVIGGGEGFESSARFKERFPDIKAFGGKPEEEFHTMLNEMVRFGIQKGMDVKHAGEKPVAGEMVSAIVKGPEAIGELAEKIGIGKGPGEGVYGELKDFSASIDESIAGRLGRLSTEDVRKEAEMLIKAKGTGEGVGGLDRKALVALIVEKAGFRAFLEELHLIVKEEAMVGILKELDKMDPGTQAQEMQGMSREMYAQSKYKKDVDFFGANVIGQRIIKPQAPLYSLRTSSATLQKQVEAYKKKFGEKDVPGTDVSGIAPQDRGRFQNKYKQAVATANLIQESLAESAAAGGRGAYAEMVRSTVQNIRDDQVMVEQEIAKLESEGYRPGESITARVMGEAPVSSLTKDVLSGKRDLGELLWLKYVE